MACERLRRALYRALYVLIGTCISLYVGIRVGIQVLIHGKAILKSKERKEEPACLRDPALGQHEFVDLEDVRLHYVSAGDRSNPLMLFLHGFPDFWFTWKEQILDFKKDFWVVAPDMRGYGLSTKPARVEDYGISYLIEDVRGLITALGREKAIVVGHDWGGFVAWLFASKYEHMVDRLVTLNSAHPLAMKHQLENSFEQMVKSWYMIAFQPSAWPEMLIRMRDFAMLDRMLSVFPEEEREALKYTFSQPGALTGPINYYRANILRQDRRLQGLRYRYINTPTLIVWGEGDAYLTRKLAELSIQQAFGRVEYVAHASHWVHRQCPRKVNDHIRTFLKNTESSTAT